VCLKWALQRGGAAIPFSVNPSHCLSNLRAAVTPPLSDEDMTAIAGVDRGCRLVKGQVFLWREGQSWEDLWDPGGRIPQ
jgi:diketogulonate reductase-like aldo/keto reductase